MRQNAITESPEHKMELNDLLIAKGIAPKEVLVLRHRPTEPKWRRVLPWLAAEKPDTYNAYQQTQGPYAEKAMMRAKYVASFFGHQSGKAMFVGLYEVGNWRPLTYDEFWQIPAHVEGKEYGMQGFTGDRPSVLWFDLELTDVYAEWKGKLIVHWPGQERGWYRWAYRNQIPINAILEDSLLDADMPPWNELALTWDELKVLPSKWRADLSQWRGIYSIFDTSDRRSYVGSAYGSDNLLGRWLNYAATGHGGNKQLRERNPSTFRFSILQRVSPDMEADDVIRLESTWKDRLHTREFGLNEN